MNTGEFIGRLDRYFERDDMDGAGEFLRTVREEAGKSGDDRLLFAVLNEMMGYYRKTGERERGLESIRAGLALSERMGLNGGVPGATAELNAATTFKAFGMAETAIPHYEAAEKVYRALLTEYDSRIAGLNNNFALALCDLGRYGEAEKRFSKALFVLSHCPEKECDIANTYVNMAHLYEAKEDFERIEQCVNNALSVMASVPDGRRDGYYAFTCRKCAPSIGYFGFFAAEKELNETADGIYARNRSV